MKIHYYLGWFNEVFIEKLVRLLHEDITDRKSLFMISGYGLTKLISLYKTSATVKVMVKHNL